MFTDHRGVALSVGDRVIPIGWGEIPLWLSNTPATVVGFGRKRLQVKFDGVLYDDSLRFHSVHGGMLRKI